MVEAADSEQLNELSVNPNVSSPLAVLVCAMMAFDYFHHSLYSTNPMLVGIALGVSVLFVLSHLIPALGFSKYHAFYLICYHLLLGFLLIFIDHTLSYYLFVWILMIYLAELYFKSIGVILSSLLLLIVMFGGVYHQMGALHSANVVAVLSNFVVLVVIALIMIHMMHSSLRQSADLAYKVSQAEYEDKRLVTLINSMTEAVIATDAVGVVTTCNAAALDLLNTNVNLEKKPLEDFLVLYNSKLKPVPVMRLARRAESTIRRTDLTMQTKDRETVAIDISVSRVSITTSTSKQQGYTFLIRDISREKSLDDERDLFISEVSHELRTPIAVAEANVSMASTEARKPELNTKSIQNYVDKAHEQVVFLGSMINDLTTLSRAERADEDMEVETFSVGDVADEFVRTFAPQAQAKGLYLKTDIEPNLEQLTTSKLYFQEILQNFITNALKYTKTGGITISAKTYEGKTIQILVKDTGIGIAHQEINKVFEKFWRSEDPYTRETSGTGLGLYIAAKLVKRINARLLLFSKQGQGSIFGMLVPIIAVQTVDQRKLAESEAANIF